jgi:hypothetical protein
MKKRTPVAPVCVSTILAAYCHVCGHPMSARTDTALAEAIGEHFIGKPICRNLWLDGRVEHRETA